MKENKIQQEMRSRKSPDQLFSNTFKGKGDANDLDEIRYVCKALFRSNDPVWR